MIRALIRALIRDCLLAFSCGLLLLAAAGAGSAAELERKTLEIGSPAPDFDLPGVDGQCWRLADFVMRRSWRSSSPATTARPLKPTRTESSSCIEDYKDRGVSLVAISPNDPQALRLDELGYTDVGDSLEDMKIRAKDRGFQFPYLYDGETQAVSAAYGVLRHAPRLHLSTQVASCAMWDGLTTRTSRRPTSHDARNAIDAMLAGRPVPVATTSASAAPPSGPTSGSPHGRASRPGARGGRTRTDRPGRRPELAANDTEKLRLVNVWATWCSPCVAELPELTADASHVSPPQVRIDHDQRGRPRQGQEALEMLKEHHVSCKNYLFDSDDRYQLMEALDKESPGPVPYTVLIAPGGKVIYRHDGPLEPREVRKAVVDHLGRTYASRDP